MNWNKFLLAGVVGSVVVFVIGWVWHVPLFGSFYAEQQATIRRGEVMMELIVLAEIVRGFVLAYIYPFGYKGGAPWLEGLRFGVILGLFACVGALVALSVLNFASPAWFWMQAIFLIIQQAAAGIGIAYVYGTQGGKMR